MAFAAESVPVATAVIRVSRRTADRLRAGHVWVYRTEIEAVSPSHANASEPGAGALVTVTDGRGIALGSAIYSTTSTIAARVVTREPGLTREGYLDLLRERVAAAVALRDELAPRSAENDARRLLFSEADGMPGIVADQYGPLVLVQLLTQATAADDVRAVLGEVLARALSRDLAAGGPALRTVWERTDARVRELEQLGPPSAAPLWSAPGTEPQTTAQFHLNGLAFHYDAGAGQKTGAFLDQRLNYAAAAAHAHGRALDVCTYQGGFALHLARRCTHVTGVDASRAALEVADGNYERNRSALAGEIDWIEADAFELMRAWDATGERFDTVVLDPPAFAKSRRAAESALRGYKELNLRALRMLRPGGTLVTCSCSHHVSAEDFHEVVRGAATDSGRAVQVMETRGAAPDHPAMLALPETSYLKCLICRVR